MVLLGLKLWMDLGWIWKESGKILYGSGGTLNGYCRSRRIGEIWCPPQGVSPRDTHTRRQATDEAMWSHLELKFRINLGGIWVGFGFVSLCKTF